MHKHSPAGPKSRMYGHGEKLSRKQEDAIAALLTQHTVRGAARAAGICTTTLRKWLSQPGFKAAYDQTRADILQKTVELLQRASSDAVDALRKRLKSPRHAQVMEAARLLLHTTVAMVGKVDIVARLKALEARARDERGKSAEY